MGAPLDQIKYTYDRNGNVVEVDITKLDQDIIELLLERRGVYISEKAARKAYYESRIENIDKVFADSIKKSQRTNSITTVMIVIVGACIGVSCIVSMVGILMRNCS